MTDITRVLVIGATGMLGRSVFSVLSVSPALEVWGVARGTDAARAPRGIEGQLLAGVDALNNDSLLDVFRMVRPGCVVNCVGLVKQRAEASDPLAAIPINSLFPHRLARLASLGGARVVHVSTDCVFNGKEGQRYVETDKASAEDVYGLSKYLGELSDYSNAVTLRTSIIGHETGTRQGLLEWFLAQVGPISGYTRAVFSGLTTVELATVIRDYVVNDRDLQGLFHVSADPIDKYSLLNLISQVYRKEIEIRKDASVVIDRSLDSSKFRKRTGYRPPSWAEMIAAMYRDQLARNGEVVSGGEGV